MQLNLFLDRTKSCFIPDWDEKPTKEDNVKAIGILVVAVALRALGLLNNTETLVITGLSSTFLLSNVVPLPLFNKGPKFATIPVMIYLALKTLGSLIIYATTPYTLSQLKDQITSLDKYPNQSGGFETYTRVSDRIRDVSSNLASLNNEDQLIVSQIKEKLESLKSLDPSLLDRTLARKASSPVYIYNHTTHQHHAHPNSAVRHY